MDTLPGYDLWLTGPASEDREPATCPTCNEYAADCTCDDEDDLPAFQPEPAPRPCWLVGPVFAVGR